MHIFRHSSSPQSSTRSLDSLDGAAASSSSVSSKPSRSSLRASPDADTILWQRMLALQRRYHCYNSARISAALQDASMAVPPRACLDLLNDGIATALLSDEARAQVAALTAPDRHAFPPSGAKRPALSMGRSRLVRTKRRRIGRSREE